MSRLLNNTFTGIRKERQLQTVIAGKKLAVPKKRNLRSAGNSIANQSEVILNKSDGLFYGHNGSSWLPMQSAKTILHFFPTEIIANSSGELPLINGLSVGPTSLVIQAADPPSSSPNVILPPGKWLITLNLLVMYPGNDGNIDGPATLTAELNNIINASTTTLFSVSQNIDNTDSGVVGSNMTLLQGTASITNTVTSLINVNGRNEDPSGSNRSVIIPQSGTLTFEYYGSA